MPTIAKEKIEFKAPADQLEHHAVGAVVQPAPLIGTWLNDDKATRGLVKVVVATAPTGITIHAYGNCTPTPCDWGVVTALSYAVDVSSAPAVAFTANYKFPFKQTVIVGLLDAGALIIETFDHFTDRSGRSNYVSKGYFHKS